ncbi:MAG TPA: branched-chain amino acid aminotransferase, partial [Alphaproteobacteria bacterium]|nr:branched-chain amino acid aminotransferase [Alphaproteobacteria bacterium]
MLDQPYDDRDGWIWIDGKMVPWREAKIHVLSHGLNYASAVFEGTRAYGGKIFKCEEHTARLFYSAETLRMKIPYSQDEVNAATREVLQKNNLGDAYIRPLVWRGPEQMGIAGLKTQTHIMIAAWFWPSYFTPEQHERGLRLMMANWQRISAKAAPIHAKASGLYVTSTMAKQEADALGYDDALVLDHRGHVAEATVANIFFVKNGELHTPTPDAFLDGITRQTVLELAARRGIKVHIRTILPSELGDFDGCFLTGTAAEIAPVGEIAEHRYKLGDLVRG